MVEMVFPSCSHPDSLDRFLQETQNAPPQVSSVKLSTYHVPKEICEGELLTRAEEF